MESPLLGPLGVERQGGVVELAGGRLRLLVAVLALQAGRVVTAERLIGLLWEGASLPVDPANPLQALGCGLGGGGGGERRMGRLGGEGSLPVDPANALQALVSRLRRALAAVGAGERLVSRPSGYLLAVVADQVD